MNEPIPEQELPEQVRENLDSLKTYAAETDEGRLVILPIVSDDGENVRFDARIHPEGVAGALPVTEETLDRIGAPADWMDKTKIILGQLEAAYPQLQSLEGRLALPDSFEAEDAPEELPAGEIETERDEQEI